MNLPPADARALLADAPVARLATVDERGQPHLVPVTFAAGDDSIVIAIDDKPKRTTDLKRLRNIRANSRVAVLADHYEDAWERLWWVRADGIARIVEAGEEHDAAVRRLVERYRQYREHPPEGPVITIAVTAWSGWSYSDQR